MRLLSRAEAVVARDQLVAPAPVPLDVRALPRRTTETVRRRLASRAWVVDRLVPNPPAVGLPFVTFALARPHGERHAELLGAWMEQAGIVLLWTSADILFGVLFSRDRRTAEHLGQELVPGSSVQSGLALSVDAGPSSIPVYFDFEGSWVAFAQLEGTSGYPRPLPGGSPASPGRSWAPDDPHQAGLLAAIASPVGLNGLNGSARPHPPGRLARGPGPRLLRSGYIERRTFLDPIAVSRWVSGFPARVAFVYGDLVEGASAPALYRGLVERAGIAPFLFATDDQRVLLGTLSADPRQTDIPPPRGAEPVLRVLRDSLQGISVVRESLSSLSVPIQHRYENPIAARTESRSD